MKRKINITVAISYNKKNSNLCQENCLYAGYTHCLLFNESIGVKLVRCRKCKRATKDTK